MVGLHGGHHWGRTATWERVGTRATNPLRQLNSQRSRGLLFLGGQKSYDRGPAEADLPPARVPRDERLARLEGVLFVSREPLSSRKLGQLASLADGTEARTLIGQLNNHYGATGSAFRVEEVAGGYQLLTRPAFGSWLRRLYRTPLETRLSAPASETLAVVAYRQPVVRATIEAIRGVQCGEILRQLMERDLVRIVGRSGELGRPFLYGTTKRFLELFGLRNLAELPRAEELRSASTGEPVVANAVAFADEPLDSSHLG